ncbi:MAG TPA: hypothetical protein PLV52_00210 [Candidatus Omnitrophota bacterium]|nr:hypothetical protein [Candidatus Omnitrophota bacterium]
MSIYPVYSGFSRPKKKKTVAERKEIRRMMVRKKVKELKAAGKPVDLQAVNKEVLEIVRRKRQRQRPKNTTRIIKL